MKKISFILCSLLAMCLGGCNDSSGQATSSSHEHTFNNDVWEYDASYHWHPSTCGHDVTSTKTLHSFVDEVVEPTYQQKGYTLHKCTVCNYSYQDTETVHEHNPGNPIIENMVEPTCTEDGSYDLVTYCVDDNVEISRERKTIPALNHDLVYHEGRAATCTEDGWNAYETCNRCDYSTYVVIPATGHQHLSTREENRVEPTCTENGSYDLVTYCTDDNFEISRVQKVLPFLGHDLIHHAAQEPTCTAVGWDAYDTCSRCNYTTYNEISPTGHQHLSTREENRVEPTCITDGSYDLVTYCVDDNVEISRVQKVLPSLGHDLIHHAAQEPTCTAVGWEAYDTCSRCNYTNKVIIPSTGHQHLSTREENRVEPTCTTDGSYDLVTYCIDDNVEISRENKTIPAPGHDLIHHAAQEPTCTAVGWEAYDTCSRCDYTTYNEISPTGHRHLATREENRIEPTCTEDGSYDLVTYCTDDNFEISREHHSISALGHSYDGVETQPTFEEDGYWTYTCSICGDTYIQKGKDKLPHNYSNDWSYDETNHWHYCIDEGYETDKGSISSHDFIKEVSAPTGLTEGYTTYTCSVCGYSYVGDIVGKLTYTITWENWDGTVLEVDEGLAYNSFPHFDGLTPTKDDDSSNSYVFAGWSPELSQVTDNATYVAQYTTYAHYMISYNLNGGTNNPQNPSFYTALSETITLKEPSRAGYNFIGWTGTNGDVPQIDVSFDGSNLIERNYIANWELAVYNVQYILNGGTNSSKNPAAVTIEDTIELKDATRTGYTFGGWYLDDVFTKRITSISNQTSDLILYAKFVPNSYTVTYVSPTKENGLKITLKYNRITNDKSVDYYVEAGSTFNPYDHIPSGMTGYIFKGWYTENGVLLNEKTQTPIYTDVTYTAKWVYSSYSRLSSSGGTQSGDKTATYVVPDAICSIHFILKSSVESKVYSYRAYCSLKINGTLMLECLVDSKSGSKWVYDTFTVKPGDTVEMYTNYTSNSSYKISASIEYTVEGKYTYPICAKNTTSSSTIYYDSELSGVELFNSEYMNYRRGYTFVGWKDQNGNLVDTYQFTENTTLTAQWDINEYTITYVLNGGTNSLLNPTIYTVEDAITFEPASKPGFDFKGWYSDAGFENKVTKISDEIGDKTLYAKFTPATFAGTIELNGGTMSPTITFISDGDVINTKYLTAEDVNYIYYPPEKDGYIFAGWYTDAKYNSIFEFKGTINYDLTLYAKWIETDTTQHIITNNSAQTEDIVVNGLNENKITFVPISSGNITITTSSNMDVKGVLYNSNMNAIQEADDIDDDNLNFSMTYYVEAGKQYTIGIKGATSLTKGDCQVSFTFGGSLGVTGITMDSYEIAVVYGSSFTLMTPVKEGYIFLGWFDANGNPIDMSNWNFTSNTTIYAHWQLIE